MVILLFYNYAVMSTTYNTGSMLKEIYRCIDQGSFVIIPTPKTKFVGVEK